ncbi:MAG: hypothetical protein DRQ65_04700 [Gammaproteobacteria bacterium]|nr:MAG: hypothetical protein DRQ65_04700 [Gammaproteobacteria bacterium]
MGALLLKLRSKLKFYAIKYLHHKMCLALREIRKTYLRSLQTHIFALLMQSFVGLEILCVGIMFPPSLDVPIQH